MSKESQTAAELKQAQNEQVRFLLKSCLAFDQGDFSEAKRLSVALRILLKESRTCHSLLHMVDPSAKLVSYKENHDPHDGCIWVQRNFVVCTLMNPMHSYLPFFLSQYSNKRLLNIQDWLDEIIIEDAEGRSFSRSKIIFTMADQDGGAHVDPGINSDYHALTRMNSQQSFIATGMDFNPAMGMPQQLPIELLKTPQPPVWHSIRHMAHETLESLEISYEYDPHTFYGGFAFSGFGLA